LNAQNSFAESEKVLSQGVRRSPGAWQFYYQLARAHFGQGQYSAAEQEYLRALALNALAPPELHVRLANLYLKINAYEKAYVQMQAYLRAEPNGRFAADIKQIIRQLESSGALRPAPATISPPPG